VLSGTLDFTFADLAVALPQVKGGALRMIAVTSAKRNPLARRSRHRRGAAGLRPRAWLSLFAPAGTPKDIIQKLYLATGKALAKPDVVTKLAAIGLTPRLSTRGAWETREERSRQVGPAREAGGHQTGVTKETSCASTRQPGWQPSAA